MDIFHASAPVEVILEPDILLQPTLLLPPAGLGKKQQAPGSVDFLCIPLNSSSLEAFAVFRKDESLRFSDQGLQTFTGVRK